MSVTTPMVTRRARDQEEEKINQLLSARGLLEPGMSYCDKKDLMYILTESENMAGEKTDTTCTEDMQVEPDCEGDQNDCQNDEKIMENVNEDCVGLKGRKQPPRKLYSNRSSSNISPFKTISKSEISPKRTSSPKNGVHDVEAEKEEEVAKVKEKECDEIDIPKISAGRASTENMELDVESASNVEPSKSDNSDIEMLPESPELLVNCKQEAIRKVRPANSKKFASSIKNCTFSMGNHTAKDDGNINVFDTTCSTCESAVTLQRRFVEAQERFPFFFLRQGITLDSFTDHFKKYVERYRKNLLHIQRSSVNFLEWGKPIPVTFIKSGAIVGDSKKADITRAASSNSYNFRDRVVKHKDPYSVSDSENFIDDPFVGVGPKETYIPDSSGSESDGIISRRDKRKSDHNEDHEWKNSPEGGRPSVGKRTKLSLSKNADGIDSDDDFAPVSCKRTNKRGSRRGGGKGRAGKMLEAAKQPNRKQPSSRGKSRVAKPLTVLMEGVEDSVSTELCSQKSEEFDVRQLQSPLKSASQEQECASLSPESKPNSQEFSCRNPAEIATKENSDGSDITFLGATPSEADQDEHNNIIMCPICDNSFTAEKIEVHAATCGLYPSDRSQSEDPEI